MAGKLILVGTPLGNLGDISVRAANALASCDFIAAEDTRVSVKLLNHLEIKKPMISYHEHNEKSRSGQILERIMLGETCCLITDAGMPAISDPGAKIVALCHLNGTEVVAVPGPTALTTAVALSGFTNKRFTFEGFLSVQKKARKAHLESLICESRTMVFYEAPHKIRATLADVFAVLGERNVCIVRETTKKFEEVFVLPLSKIIERYEQIEPRGEFVFVVEGRVFEEQKISFEKAIETALKFKNTGMSSSEAAKKTASETGYKKGDIYKEII